MAKKRIQGLSRQIIGAVPRDKDTDFALWMLDVIQTHFTGAISIQEFRNRCMRHYGQGPFVDFIINKQSNYNAYRVLNRRFDEYNIIHFIDHISMMIKIESALNRKFNETSRLNICLYEISGAEDNDSEFGMGLEITHGFTISAINSKVDMSLSPNFSKVRETDISDIDIVFKNYNDTAGPAFETYLLFTDDRTGGTGKIGLPNFNYKLVFEESESKPFEIYNRTGLSNYESITLMGKNNDLVVNK